MQRVTRSRHRQRGLSAVGWLLIAVMFGFLLLTFFRVFPMYYDNLKVQTALDGMAQDKEVDFGSRSAIWNALTKRLLVQGVRDFKQEYLIVSKNSNGMLNLRVKYEVRSPYLANLFIGASFDESVVVNR